LVRRSAVWLLSAGVAAGLLAGMVSSAAGARQAAFKPAAVSFISPGKGWVLGASGCSACAVVRRTTDGGGKWTALPSPRVQLPFERPRSGDVADIAFADSRNGFLFGPALLVSHNGGKSWKRDALPPVHALGLGAGYAFALTQQVARGRVRLWRARVGHDRWSSLPLPKDAGAPLTISDSSAVQVAVEGKNVLLLRPGDMGPAPTHFGRLWASNDSGHQWLTRPVPCKRQDGGAALITIARGHPRTWLIDCFDNQQSSQAQDTQHRLYRTVNAGASWIRLADPTRHNEPDLLTDSGTGHIFLATAGGAGDTLVGSLDNGRSWKLVLHDGGSFYGWADLGFVTPQVGFVVGPTHYAPEHLYRTDNAGRTWQILRTS
jgi:photosystem II stability/assembly factor-like uncharacterized protein